MALSSICNGCRIHLKNRLRNCILLLQSQRRSYLATRILSADITTPANSRSWYWDTVPPASKDLASATSFFRTYLPRKLWTATEWRKQNEPVGGTLVPEVAFLGRSNVGKSSLLNALLLSPQLNHVGPRPGKTTTMHAWGLAASDPVTGGALRGRGGDTSVKIALLDMPGYGHASHGDWGKEIITYLKRRKQLKRVFILLDALHGVKLSDLRMLDLLRRQAISHQVIASKCDRLVKRKDAQAALTEVLGKMKNAVQPDSRAGGFVCLGEILAVGALGDGKKNNDISDEAMMGIEEVRYAVLKAAGLESMNSPPIAIPVRDGIQLPLLLDWKAPIHVTKDEPVVSEQTSPAVYESARGPHSRGDEPLTATGAVFRTDNVEDATIAADRGQSATAEPFVASHPVSDRCSPPEPSPATILYTPTLRMSKTKFEPVPPIHVEKIALATDKAAPELPSPSARKQPYTGSIGYGLRDLYEMTATKPSRDNKLNLRRQQRRRRSTLNATI